MLWVAGLAGLACMSGHFVFTGKRKVNHCQSFEPCYASRLNRVMSANFEHDAFRATHVHRSQSINYISCPWDPSGGSTDNMANNAGSVLGPTGG